jgi:uncharacterized repeat protein (TIGR03803 family)
MTNWRCGLGFLVMLGLSALTQAQTFTVLYNFTGGAEGGNPSGGLVQDSAGNLYGTATSGGSNYGVVFEVSKVGKENVPHSFAGNPDGEYPFTPVVRDSQGNLYGTTYEGGSSSYGTVLKIDNAGKETVLHSFSGGNDGCYPMQGLTRDDAGNLYGTASFCGSSGYGTIFKIDTARKFSVLHSFTDKSSDGAGPYYGHLTMGKSGNLYGVTGGGGGPSNYGVVYKLSSSGKFTMLHRFVGGTTDGCYPLGSVALDKAGNLYGTTEYCSANGRGNIWEVSQTGKETILHNFEYLPSDACNPAAGVTLDSKGNLYGVTLDCGTNYSGALYELTLADGALTLLHSFGYKDGDGLMGEVWLTDTGTLFGTATAGGTYDNGTLWSYVP